MTDCNVLNFTAISCVAPPLITQSPLGDGDSRLNYTIIVDDAPGPDLAMDSLQISVLPDPGNFTLITTQYTSQQVVQISVSAIYMSVTKVCIHIHWHIHVYNYVCRVVIWILC